MLSILIKAVAIYIFIGFLRNIWKGYKMHKALKEKTTQSFKKKHGHDGNVVDAEFRELKDDET